MDSLRKCAAVLFMLLAAMGLLTVTFGWLWLGWGYIAENEDLLDSLTVPPGVQRIWIGSHSYTKDDGGLMPPDGWGTRATYQAPSETSREDIVDFFLSELSPEWQSCVIEINVVEAATGKSTQMMGGASFTRGSSVVSIDTDNMLDEAPHTFDIFVDHERGFEPCAADAP